MMDSFEILGQNKEFMMNAFNVSSFMSVFVLLALLELVLKGWALWRAARMSKQGWFIALLIINSAGILPAIFLLVTNSEYERKGKPVMSASQSAKLLKPASKSSQKKK